MKQSRAKTIRSVAAWSIAAGLCMLSAAINISIANARIAKSRPPLATIICHRLIAAEFVSKNKQRAALKKQTPGRIQRTKQTCGIQRTTKPRRTQRKKQTSRAALKEKQTVPHSKNKHKPCRIQRPTQTVPQSKTTHRAEPKAKQPCRVQRTQNSRAEIKEQACRVKRKQLPS